MEPQNNIADCSEGKLTLSLKSDIKDALNGYYAGVDLAVGSDCTVATAYGTLDHPSSGVYSDLKAEYADSIAAINDCTISATFNGVATWNTINEIVSYPRIEDFYTDGCSTSGTYIINTTDTYNPFAGCFDIIKINRKRISLTI